jgi:hypothetical protein
MTLETQSAAGSMFHTGPIISEGVAGDSADEVGDGAVPDDGVGVTKAPTAAKAVVFRRHIGMTMVSKKMY